MRAAVIVFPGSNRDGDVFRALNEVTGRRPVKVWHADRTLPDGVDLVVLPGGFSYGDYLRCGAIAARAPVMAAVAAHAARGGLVLGICNGDFQISSAKRACCLACLDAQRRYARFTCRMQHLAVARADTAFTRAYRVGEVIKVAIAHGEGNYTAARRDHRAARRRRPGGIPLLRCRRAPSAAAANPNGSTHDIAGIYSEKLNVLGLMPHPENLIDRLVWRD